jgi:hypothetical protein
MQGKLGFILLVVIATMLTDATVAYAQPRSGERQLGKKIIEPGYDDRTGKAMLIMVPVSPISRNRLSRRSTGTSSGVTTTSWMGPAEAISM